MRDVLPYRPRLADHVVARRHLADGDERIALLGGGAFLVLDATEWAVLQHADGTRDADGVLLAAAREGSDLPASRWRELLCTLARGDMLVDGIRSPLPHVGPPDTPPDRPLDPLPGYRFRCDGTGGCCGQYGTILFTREEADRARVLVPAVLGGGPRVFVPARGTVADGRAVTLVDGRCAYVRDDGLCSVHAIGGLHAKPLRCQLFPTSLVDDGDSVRASASVECGCVLTSVGRADGDGLVPDGTRVVGDLGPGTPIRALPVEIPLTAHGRADRGEVARWSRALCASRLPADAARAFGALADTVALEGLDPRPSVAALRTSPPTDPSPLASLVGPLCSFAGTWTAAAARYRSQGDRVRRMMRWISEAAAELRTQRGLEGACARSPPDPVAERFYLHATLHGHDAVRDAPLVIALRDRAVRILLARLLPGIIARDPAGAGDVAARHPLCAIEVAMRGHGLSAYAVELAE